MATDNINLKTWAGKFLAGDFERDPLLDEDYREACIAAGWYDWFCKDTSLGNKTKVLGRKVLQVMKSPKVDPEKNYVFFKNNCPFHGNLYDDFRICDMETGDVIYTVVPRSGFSNDNGVAQVFGRENDFNGPLAEGRWKDIRAFFEL